MKRKPVRRKAKNGKPALLAKPLRDIGGTVLKRVPYRPYEIRIRLDGKPTERRTRTEVGGIPLPPDLEAAVRYYASEQLATLEQVIFVPPWEQPWVSPEDNESQADYPDWKEPVLNPDDFLEIRSCVECSFRQGFYLALLRYADDLKQSAEVSPVLERLKRAAKKGGAARRERAAPRHKAICKRFRELRKTVPKVTARYLRIAKEFGMDEGSVGRIVREYLS